MKSARDLTRRGQSLLISGLRTKILEQQSKKQKKTKQKQKKKTSMEIFSSVFLLLWFERLLTPCYVNIIGNNSKFGEDRSFLVKVRVQRALKERQTVGGGINCWNPNKKIDIFLASPITILRMEDIHKIQGIPPLDRVPRRERELYTRISRPSDLWSFTELSWV